MLPNSVFYYSVVNSKLLFTLFTIFFSIKKINKQPCAIQIKCTMKKMENPSGTDIYYQFSLLYFYPISRVASFVHASDSNTIPRSVLS